MNQLAVLFILLIIIAIGVSIYFMYNRDRKRGVEKQTAALDMGFQLVKEVDPSLTDRIIQFYKKSKGQNLRVRNVFERSESDATLYLFDLLDYSGESVNYLADGAIMVVSPSLRLPRFSIYPKLGDRSHVSGWADALLEKIATRQMDQIVLGKNPYFEKNYFLTGENEAEVREFLTEYILSHFNDQKFWRIEAGGDLFTFSNLDSRRNIDAGSPLELRDRQQEALSLFELFRASEPSQD
jgi:hypothetical protein